MKSPELPDDVRRKAVDVDARRKIGSNLFRDLLYLREFIHTDWTSSLESRQQTWQSWGNNKGCMCCLIKWFWLSSSSSMMNIYTEREGREKRSWSSWKKFSPVSSVIESVAFACNWFIHESWPSHTHPFHHHLRKEEVFTCEKQTHVS